MQLLNFITCDEIRQESSGKHTFIGVYDGIAINFQGAEKWPAAIRLAIYMKIKKDSTSKNPTRVEFKIFREGVEKTSVNNELNLDDPRDTFSIILNFNSLVLTGPGTLNFKILFFHKDEILKAFSPEPLVISSIVQNQSA